MSTLCVSRLPCTSHRCLSDQLRCPWTHRGHCTPMSSLPAMSRASNVAAGLDNTNSTAKSCTLLRGRSSAFFYCSSHLARLTGLPRRFTSQLCARRHLQGDKPTSQSIRLVTMAQHGLGGTSSVPKGPDNSSGDLWSRPIFKGLSWGAGGLVVIAAALAIVQNAGYGPLLKEWATSSALGKSGFLAAFALIFLSEIGDKTFFIAGLLAMKVGRAVSFIGSTAALALMTLVSVVIGYGFKSVPDALKSSVPIGRYSSVACMLYFGVRTLKEAWGTPDSEGSELASAQLTLEEVEKSGTRQKQTVFQSTVQVGTIIFLAEWGDRSMLATVALGASHSPLGVAVGAIVGHALATLLAVTGGALASQYISERTLGFVGGALFLVFAVATLVGAF